jgi:hypothetical protein
VIGSGRLAPSLQRTITKSLQKIYHKSPRSICFFASISPLHHHNSQQTFRCPDSEGWLTGEHEHCFKQMKLNAAEQNNDQVAGSKWPELLWTMLPHAAGEKRSTSPPPHNG